MIGFGLDLPSAAIVLATRGDTTAGDFQAPLDALELLVRRARGMTIAAMAIVEPGASGPDAVVRRRIAAAKAGAGPHRMALVTESAVSRGVMTAIDWLSPSTAGQRSRAFATVHEARSWLEDECRRELDVLPRLIASARAALEVRHH